MKDLYGRGPTHAKTYRCDEYVVCVMSGGMTRDEETMIRGGAQDAVRDYRLRFPIRHRSRAHQARRGRVGTQSRQLSPPGPV
jgi:hypothetical protein